MQSGITSPVLVLFLALIHVPCLDAGRVHQRIQTHGSLNRSALQMNNSIICHKKIIKRPVYLLFTNHGFSCGDIVDEFSAKGMFGRHSFKDPLLSTAGAKRSMEAADDVRKWLRKKWLQRKGPNVSLLHDVFSAKVDAVLASNLERTIHTAALQYPGEKIIPCPFIKGRSQWYTGNSENRAKPLSEQESEVDNAVKSILKSIPGDHKFGGIDFELSNKIKEYAKDYGKSWDTFRHFLSNVLLPKLEAEAKKPDYEPHVIAIVTQPQFMNEGEVFQRCADRYRKSPRTKKREANRNQVVGLPYTFMTKCMEGKTKYELLDTSPFNDQCEVVSQGVEMYEGSAKQPKDMCQKDIGDVCEALQDDKSFPWLIENQLQDQFEALGKMQKEITSYETKLKKSQREAKTKMEEYAATDVVARAKNIKNQMKILESLKKEEDVHHNLWQELNKMRAEFQKTKARECWTGGKPYWNSHLISMGTETPHQYDQLNSEFANSIK